MLFFTTLFIIFFYFKLARVHKKGEIVDNKTYIMHTIVALCAVAIYGYGVNHYSYLSVAMFSFIFFIVAALMITAVQVGVFVEGKPFIGISKLYKFMPIIAGAIAVLTIILLAS
jgi:hypothetical protein